MTHIRPGRSVRAERYRKSKPFGRQASRQTGGWFSAVRDSLRRSLDARWNRRTETGYELDQVAEQSGVRRQQLDAVLLEALRPFILGSSILIAAGAVYLGFVLGTMLGLAGILMGLTIGAVFIKVYLLLRAGLVPVRFAHPLAASVSAVGFALLVFGLIADKQSSGDLRFMALALTVVMAGALYLTLRWLLGMMAFMFSNWIVINLVIGFEFTWSRQLAGLLFIALTTLVGYSVRKRAIVRMIEVQHENERQNTQLIEALERAHRSEAELHVERYLADQIVDSMGQGLVLVDSNGLIEYANPAAEEIFGQAIETLTGTAVDDIFQGQDRRRHEPIHGNVPTPRDSEETYEVVIEQAHGTVASILVSTAGREDGGSILTLTDLTVRKQFEAKLERLAHYDALTGLTNRPHFIQRLEEVATDRRKRPVQIAVLFLDLDRFKQINDTMGHAVGDQVLIESANRIQNCIRTQDTAARFGGDEFLVLLVDIEHEGVAVEIAERIVGSIKEPFILPDSIQTLSGSIGISIGWTPDIDPEELIRQADIAMYEAKRDRFVSSVVYRQDQRSRLPQVA